MRKNDYVNTQPSIGMYRPVKRCADIVVSVLALVILSPLFLLVFMIDRVGENRGKVFFKQQRLGLNGKKFFIYKFRSMVTDADNKLRNNPELFKKYKENNYKLPDGEDPRVTRFGRILRKTSLDEVPQFINIIRGEMSLIGPRPIVPIELEEYGDTADKFLSVKPGALGYWQATGRSEIGYPERCEIELFYVDHASIGFDTRIFFTNILSIFKGEGAF